MLTHNGEISHFHRECALQCVEISHLPHDNLVFKYLSLRPTISLVNIHPDILLGRKRFGPVNGRKIVLSQGFVAVAAVVVVFEGT